MEKIENRSLKTKSGKKPVCFFTLASPRTRYEEYAQKMVKSFKKFHPDIPIFIRPFEEIHNFRIYALHGQELSKEYELVVNIDNDSIVAGSLDHIINDNSYELGCVLNNNLIDPRLHVWDTPWHFYINAGLIAVRGERPWNWWQRLNYSSHWKHYRFREQDMLNIIFHYGDLVTKIFDSTNKWHGLISKGRWHRCVIRDDNIVLPKEYIKEYIDVGFPFKEEDKQIKVIHWAGGAVPKLNFHTHFTPAVAKRLQKSIA